MGWFFGLKLHFVINHKGQVMALQITPGNIADSTVLDEITQHLTGKLYADKGYISRALFHKLWQRGLHLITGIRRNMRNYLMPLADKLMLRKRFVIETVLDILKSEMGLELSRHRSVIKQNEPRSGATVMQAMPRPLMRAQASEAAADDNPDRRARNATWLPNGVVAGSSIFAIRSKSGAAFRAFSAAAWAELRLAKAPTCTAQ